MIRPGLERISRLLIPESLPWKSIHVAGTNGKGSICAYISAMLHAANLGPIGRFTSPHIIDRWDCITVNEQTISESIFRKIEDQVKQRNDSLSINASEFELLTATAFEIFTSEKVRVGVVECGMGGRLDATNVLQKPLVTVISRIGLDHQAFLGNTLEHIAREKAGIMKHGSPCVVDVQDDESTLRVLREVATAQNIPLDVVKLFPRSSSSIEAKDFEICLFSSDGKMSFTYPDSFGLLLGKDSHGVINIQRRNMCCAFRAVTRAMPALGREEISARSFAPAMKGAMLPGRFQTIDLEPITGISGGRALLDGAHNYQAIRNLSKYVGSHLRSREPLPEARPGITWVVALSQGKMSKDLFRYILLKDNVIAVEFGPVDGMPWARPVPASEITDIVNEHGPRTGQLISLGSDVRAALRKASEIAKGTPIVIMGSLYLVSDVLRLLRDAGGETGMPKSNRIAFPEELVPVETNTLSRSENDVVDVDHVSVESAMQGFFQRPTYPGPPGEMQARKHYPIH